jgi:hypothetical protein
MISEYDPQGFHGLKDQVKKHAGKNLDKAETVLSKLGLKNKENYEWVTEFLIKITIGKKVWSFWPSKSKWKRRFGRKKNKETQKGLVELKGELKAAIEEEKSSLFGGKTV